MQWRSARAFLDDLHVLAVFTREVGEVHKVVEQELWSREWIWKDKSMEQTVKENGSDCFGPNRFRGQCCSGHPFGPIPLWENTAWARPVQAVFSRTQPPDRPISRFIFPLPFSLFLSLSWWSSRGILVVFEAPGPSNVHVWIEFSGCRVKP